MEKNYKKAYFAGGCFWCTEAVFKRIKGVIKTQVGYSGGDIKNPTYEQVSLGNTGHAETLEVVYNPSEISYKDLLYVFFKIHDPTTLNRQGPDIGSQYRSAIFYVNNKQKIEAKDMKKKLNDDEYDSAIATKIVKFDKFYSADISHQEYYEKNPDSAYCRLVIDPKIRKLEENLSEYRKTKALQ